MANGELMEAKEATAEVSARPVKADLLLATALLKAIGEISPDAIYAKGVDGRFLYANPAVLAIIGKAADEVLGRTDIEIHSDPRQAAIIMANDRRIIEAGVPDVIEEIWNVSEFDTRTYRATKTPFYRDDGSLVGIICLSADITESKRAEETLRKNAALTRLAADAARMTYAEFDFRTGRLRLAENFARVMGYTLPSLTEPEDMPKTGADMLSHIAPEYREQVQAANREFVSGERDGSIIYRVIGDDGAERWIEGRWIAEVDANGCPVRGIAASLDITERRRAEQALRESEHRLKLLAEASANVVYRMSPDWGEMRQLTGVGFLADSASPSPAWPMQYIPSDERKRVAAAIDEAIRSRSIFELEHRVILADGGVGWIFSRAVPLLDRDGDIVEWIGSACDVTARKQDELTLRESEAALRLSQIRLRNAADAAKLTYAEFDFRNERLHLADNFAQVMGYAPPPAETDLAKITADLVSHVAPEDRPRVQAANKEFLEGKLGGSVTYRIIGDDGAVRWIEGKWSAEADANGCLTRAMATSLDVTAQVEGKIALAEAKEKADEILASIGDGFYALDAKWRFVYFNAQAEMLLNKKRDDVIGRAFFDVFPMVRDTQVHANYRQAMAGKQARDFEYVSPIYKRWTYFSVCPTREGGISVYFRDISPQKTVEGELVAAKADAERADLAKSKFLAAASHDLRQPVQSLVLLLSVIERQVANQPKTVETAKMMRAAVDGLHGLLTSVLDISRLDAGVVAPVDECVDLGALVGRLATEYESKVANKALELRSVPLKLQSRTDPCLLERALRNLIENALRYTPDGGILLGVRRRGEFARIDVIDTGVGIAADKQSEIFVEFHQLDNPGRNLEKGLGLGLAIVSRLAKLLGAKVEVASRVGRGSRFSICLPLVHDAVPTVADRGAVDDPGGRILIIEDNAIVRNGLEAMLQQCGYEILAAAFGEDALELAAREAWRCDMIVADYRLGAGLTGVDAAKEISHRAGRSIPTLVLTGDTDRERIAEISVSGFAILHKPVDAEDLRREIARMLSD